MKLKSFKSSPTVLAVAICAVLSAMPYAGNAQSSFIINTSSGSFLSADGPTLNYGSAGTFAIAPASAAKGEFDSVLMFNTSAAVSQFNGLWGAGNWAITGLMLSLASNFPTQGESINNPIFNNINTGTFGIDWLADNNWSAGSGGGMGGTGYPNNSSVSFDYIPTLFANGSDSLGLYTYSPPGNQSYQNYSLPLDGNLVSGAEAGGAVSLYFYAPTSSQIGYLFNSQNFASNHPELTLTATPTPEPATFALLTMAAAGLWVARRQKRKS
jgi:hypothetical protein